MLENRRRNEKPPRIASPQREVDHFELVHQVDRRRVDVGHPSTRMKKMKKMKKQTTVGDHHGRRFLRRRAGKGVRAEPDVPTVVRSRVSQNRRVGPVAPVDPTGRADPTCLSVQAEWAGRTKRTKTTKTDHRRKLGSGGGGAGRPS